MEVMESEVGVAEEAASFYTKLYSGSRTKSLRRYPHDEMMRFIGRHFFKFQAEDSFFHFDRPERQTIRILEVGCGAGSNLWAIAKEGFSAYGLDLAPEALGLCRRMLSMWGVDAELTAGDMRKLPYPDNFFDGIVDIYSSCCLRQSEFDQFLSEIRRTLRPGGKFYCWTPSDRSEAFINHAPAILIEPYTLDGIRRESSPFFGNNYPFRFMSPATATESFEKAGLRLFEIERTGRTYRRAEEYFEWLSLSAERPADTAA